MNLRQRAKRLGDAQVSIERSLRLLAGDCDAPEELVKQAFRPKGRGGDKLANQMAGVARLLEEVTYAQGLAERPVPPEPEPPEPEASAEEAEPEPEPPEEPKRKRGRAIRRR